MEGTNRESPAQANCREGLEGNDYRSSDTQILSLARGLVRKKLFRTTMICVSKEVKEMNGVPETHMQQFFNKKLPEALRRAGLWERAAAQQE